MTENEYNLAEGIRRSDLWRMNDSPEKFKYFLEHPIEQTQAMAFGSAAHKYVLENKEFFDEYAVSIKVDKRTKDGREAWERFCEETAGKQLVSPEEYDQMGDMMKALKTCTLAEMLLHGPGQTEVPVFWVDPETGEKCKAKCDRVLKDEDGKYYIADLKTTTDAKTGKFNRSVINFGYAFQAAMYSEGLQISLGLDYRPEFVFVAVEKKAPYSVNVIRVSPEVMEYGAKQYHALLNKMHVCKELDEWPGFLPVDGGMNWTDLPTWVDMEDEEE